MMFACECAGKCNDTMNWPGAAVIIALCAMFAIVMWAACKYS